MTKIDYGDYYRFVVSVGVALIILSLLLPWLMLREPFDLHLSESAIAALTPLADSLITRRQEAVSTLLDFLPLASGLSFVIGLILVVRGLKSWRDNQQEIDRELGLRTTKLEKEVAKMSDEEVQQKAEAEITAQLPTEEVARRPSSTEVTEYRKVEAKVADAFERCVGERAKVLRNRKIGQARYDLLVQDPDNFDGDLVVEVKLIKRNFGFGWLGEAAERLAVSVQLYGGVIRNGRSLLLVVAPRHVIDEPRVQRYVARLKTERGLGEPEFKIKLLDSGRIDQLNCTDVEEWMSVSGS